MMEPVFGVPQMIMLVILGLSFVPKRVAADGVSPEVQMIADRYWWTALAALNLILLTLAGTGGFFRDGVGLPQALWLSLLLVQVGRKVTMGRPDVFELMRKSSPYIAPALGAAELALLMWGGFFWRAA